jgi:hypothetical protein
LAPPFSPIHNIQHKDLMETEDADFAVKTEVAIESEAVWAEAEAWIEAEVWMVLALYGIS